jgi:hypothetical protein
MLAAICTVGSLIGSILNPARFVLNFAAEAGSIPTNSPPELQNVEFATFEAVKDVRLAAK